MRKEQTKILPYIPVIFLLIITVVLTAPATSQSFWYGQTDTFYEILGPVKNEAMKSCLETNVLVHLDKRHKNELLEKHWYENLDRIMARLTAEGKTELNTCLVTIVQPQLDAKLGGYGNYTSNGGVSIYNKIKAANGYTLLNATKGHLCSHKQPAGAVNTGTCGAILIDMEGNIVKEWPFIAMPAKMLPSGDVMGLALTMANGPPANGMQSLVQMDWCGTEKWRYSGEGIPLDGGARAHHDFQREGNPVGYFSPGLDSLSSGGKTLILSNIKVPFFSYISAYPLHEDAIFEVAWDGTRLWAWYPYEHFEQMGFDTTAKEGLYNVRAMGIGGVPDSAGPTDWQHVNSTSYLGPNKWYIESNPDTWIFHPDNIIYDSRTANYLAIIARKAHPYGKWQAGDIVWRVGPDYTAEDRNHGSRKMFNRKHDVGQIIGPHMAHMIPEGLPGNGNILVFDNGGVAGYGPLLPGLPGTYPATFRDYSRVMEINPVTLEVVWEYKSPKEVIKKNQYIERKFYSRLISGAQRLGNGNTLITEGIPGRIFEVTSKGEIVWEYIHKPEYANGFQILPFLPLTAIYRAYRVPQAWVDSQPACPAVPAPK